MSADLSSPLAEIEHRVQSRAKDEALDLDDAGARRALEDLVQQEVGQWNDDFRRGFRPFALADSAQVAERAIRNLTGYGPLGPLLGREIRDLMVSSEGAQPSWLWWATS